MCVQEGPLLRRGRLRACCARYDRPLLTQLAAELGPELLQTVRYLSRMLPMRKICDHVRQPRVWPGAPGLRVCFGFHDEKSSGRAERETGIVLALPNWSELSFKIEAAEFIKDQEVLALAVLRASDQGDFALTRSNACKRDPRRINSGGFLAHERAGRSGHAMNDGNVAGQQIRKLCQKQGRPEIVHQPLVQKAGSRVAPGL